MVRENEYAAINGTSAMVALLVAAIVTGFVMVFAMRQSMPLPFVGAIVALVILGFSATGLFIVNPGEAKALQLFGEYKGTVRSQGIWWANPLLTKRSISLRIRNFETAKLKVNDSRANPIEIAAIVVWKVVDTAEALFEVDDYSAYVAVQSESAVREIGRAHV